MDPSEYARLRRIIVISWTVSLILAMIVLYFGSRELATVKNAVNIQQSTLDANSSKVDKLIERVNNISSGELKAELKGDKGDKGEPGLDGRNGANGANGVNGTDSISQNTVIEKQSVEYVPVKGEKGDKGEPGEKGEDARQIELCKIPLPLLSVDISLNLGWRYVGTKTCFEIEGTE